MSTLIYTLHELLLNHTTAADKIAMKGIVYDLEEITTNYN